MTDQADPAGTARSAPEGVRERPPVRSLRMLPIVEMVTLAAFLLLPLALELTLDNTYYITGLATRVLLLAIYAISFDLCWGYSGIMAFGQALFFGAAGYLVGLLGRDAGLAELVVTVPIAILVSLVLAGLIAWFLLLGRRTPTIIFIAMGTLTTSYAAERLAGGWTYIGAANGLSSIEIMMLGPLEFFDGEYKFYYLALGFLVAVYALCRVLVKSQFGLVLAGIRENEERLAFFGYRVQAFKAVIFTFAGAVAGLSGALYSYHEGYAGIDMLGIQTSTMAVLYTFVGGTGTLIGPVLGVVAVETATNWLSDMEGIRHYWQSILGLLLLVVIAYRPTGLMGFLVSHRERVGSYGRPPRAGRDASSGKGRG